MQEVRQRDHRHHQEYPRIPPDGGPIIILLILIIIIIVGGGGRVDALAIHDHRRRHIMMLSLLAFRSDGMMILIVANNTNTILAYDDYAFFVTGGGAQVREKYYRDPHSIEEELRDYVNVFGFLQKNVNGLDILIEDGKQLLRGWGASEPNFLLLNSRLTFNLQMSPERTNYVTQGPDGQRRLEQGPDVKSWRNIRIIHSRAFAIEEGSAPRDLLRRRVRVAEFYLLPNCRSTPGGAEPPNAAVGTDDGGGDRLQGGPPRLPVGGGGATNDAAAGAYASVYDTQGEVRLYDESSDSFVVISYKKLLEQCRRFIARANAAANRRSPDDPLSEIRIPDEIGSVLLLRPNIEHQMLGLIMGKGGSIEDLGATLWGQTELSCFDDGQHGVWGMSYKYHASAIVFNNRNLIRMWDISYDGYCGGKDVSLLDWGSDQDLARFIKSDNNLAIPYSGPSIVVLPLPTQVHTLPSPLPIANLVNSLLASNAHTLATADLFVEDMAGFLNRVSDRIGDEHILGLRNAVSVAYDLLHMHRNSASAKDANLATIEAEATLIRLAYGGTLFYKLNHESTWSEVLLLSLLLRIIGIRNNNLPPTTTTRRFMAAGTMAPTAWARPPSAPAKAYGTTTTAARTHNIISSLYAFF